MAERTISAAEAELIQRAHRVLPGGSLGNIGRDIVITEGKAGRVRDASGNEYVDFLLGSGPMLIGHAHPEVNEVVREQIEKGTTFFANNDQAIALAEELVSAVACADKVRFTSSGTEATLYALRTARAYRRRDKILKFEGGYHGMHDYALMSMSPANPHDFPRPTPDSAGIPRSVEDEVLIAPFNDLEAATALIEARHDELGAVIVEPFQRLLPPKPGFLQGLREVTAQYGVPLIFDEVVTGFRFAYGGAQEFYGVEPDMCSLGKVIAGGTPGAVFGGREEVMALYDPRDGARIPQSGTFNANPFALTAGKVTLETMTPAAYERIGGLARSAAEGLERAIGELGLAACVVVAGSIFRVYFLETPPRNYREAAADDAQLHRWLHLRLLNRGIYWRLGGSISLPLEGEHVDRLVETVRDSLAELTRAG